jgi:hypothetical protein
MDYAGAGAGVPAVSLRAEARPTDLLRPVPHPKPGAQRLSLRNNQSLRRTAEAGFNIKLGCHVFRATGITAYLKRAARWKMPS